jgi:hypothetical protein
VSAKNLLHLDLLARVIHDPEWYIDYFMGDLIYQQIMTEMTDALIGFFQKESINVSNLKSLIVWLSWNVKRGRYSEMAADVFDKMLSNLSKARVYCEDVGIEKVKIDNLEKQITSLKKKAVKRYASVDKDDHVDRLITAFFDFNIRASERAKARCIEHLLKIPSLNEHMITDEGVRKRIDKLRIQGKIPKKMGKE